MVIIRRLDSPAILHSLRRAKRRLHGLEQNCFDVQQYTRLLLTVGLFLFFLSLMFLQSTHNALEGKRRLARDSQCHDSTRRATFLVPSA